MPTFPVMSSLKFFFLSIFASLLLLLPGGEPVVWAQANLPEEVVPTPPPSSPQLPAHWKTLDAPGLRFFFSPRDETMARHLAEEGPSTVEKLVAYAGKAPSGRIDVWLAPTREVFRALQGGRGPEWAAGTAWTESRRIFLRTRDLPGGNSVSQVYLHELAHVVLGEASQGRRPPRWLSEGIAQYMASEYSTSTHLALAQAVFAGRLIPLASLENDFPVSAGDAALAYAQSLDFIAYLLNRFGPETIAAMVREVLSGKDWQVALQAATGHPAEQLEEDWVTRLQNTHGWLPALTGGGLLWGFTSLLFLAASWKRSRQNKAAFIALAAKEKFTDEAEENRRREALLDWVRNEAERAFPRDEDPGERSETSPPEEESSPLSPLERPPLFVGVAFRDDNGGTQGGHLLEGTPSRAGGRGGPVLH